jgi:sulfoquinovose isomerase
MSLPDLGIPSSALATECDRLLNFGRHFPHPLGGAAWLDATGQPDLTRPVYTWITARMVHVYALGHLLGRSGDADLAGQALAGLTDRLRDSASGGWVTSIDTAGQSPDEKACYTHAFVVLAASSGTVAGLPGARDLLSEALDIWDQRFFDAAAGMFVDSWNRDFTHLDEYRGVNGNMHAVEALLAAADVTGDHVWRARALGIARPVALEFAQPHSWRIPEHFNSSWEPQLEHNRDRPDDQFQPYGATVGHGLE